jgi:hypothetical protein
MSMSKLRRPLNRRNANDGRESGRGRGRDELQWDSGQGSATAVSERTTTAGVWVVLFLLLCGPVGVLLGLRGDAVTVAPTSAQQPDRSVERAVAGEWAEQLVVTWLESSRGEEAAVERFVAAEGLKLPEVAWKVRHSSVVSATEAAAGWSVTVGVNVTRGGSPEERRYFRVPINATADGRAVALTLPSPVAAAAVADPVELVYKNRLRTGDPAWTAVAGFLSALAAGSGDVARYTTPGVVIAPITPAPYEAVQVSSVVSDTDLEALGDPVADGTELRVLAYAEVEVGGDEVGVQWPLTLTARAGRWEITAIDTAPLTPAAEESASTGNATETPTGPSSGTPTSTSAEQNAGG